jgi:hypothetical protein
MSKNWKRNQLVTHGNKPTGRIGNCSDENANEIEPLLPTGYSHDEQPKMSKNTDGVEPLLLPTELNAN